MSGKISELGTSLEMLNPESKEGLFNDNELSHMEDILRSEGIAETADLNGINIEQLIDAVDSRVKQLKPELSSKCHMSHFGKESDVWKEFRSRLEPKYLEAPSDKVQQEQIASAMLEMDYLRFENWANLSLKGKVNLLNELEQKIATIEHRSPANIRSEVMEDESIFGYQLDGDIAINEKMMIASDSNPEVLDRMLQTLIHEGRHAYQHYNVEVRMVHQSEAEVNGWRENFNILGYANGDPIKIPIIGGIAYTDEGLAKIGARLYYYQPVEWDARVFAEDTMAAYYKLLNA